MSSKITADISNELGSIQKNFLEYEQLVLDLLRITAENENKKIIMDYKFQNVVFDAYFPEGIDVYDGPTIVDVKKINKRSLSSLKKHYSNLRNVLVKHFILVTDLILTNEEKDELKSFSDNIDEKINIVFWDIGVLSELLGKNLNKISNKILNTNKIIINNEINENNNFIDIIKSDNEEKIVQLSNKYRDGNITLFLGAGVSQSAGIANWDMLVSELFVSLINENIESFKYNNTQKQAIGAALQKIQNSGPLIDVRYLRSGLGSKFIPIVKKTLYKKKVFESDLINSIVKFCVPKPGVKNIITYNFDDIIERELKKTGVRFRSVSTDNYDISNNEIGIYHVHGFLPEGNNIENNIVFSEESYHDIFLDPYSWSNIVQLNHLTESTYLFIGLSMTDPNLRRILEISAKKIKTPRHYLILKRFDFDKLMKLERNLSENYLIAHHRILENSYLELGLNTLWLDNYDEIPEIIDRIREKSI